jgi:multimeric flavodoxin WrbA
MEIIVLNGARPQDAKADETSEIFVQTLRGLGQVSTFKLRNIAVADCLGCFGCWVKTPGECVINDAARDMAKKLVNSDLTVWVTPIVFGGYSYELKKVLDRQICRIMPFFAKVNGELHHKPRYERYAKMVAIGVLPQPNLESEAIFKKLVFRNAINLYAPHYSSGIVYDSDGAEIIRQKTNNALAQVEVRA